MELPIEKIKLPQKRIRETDAQTINDLKLSIKQYGLIQPIIVRKIMLQENYEVIDGCHRFIAAKGIGLKKVQVVIREDIQTEADALIMSLHGNIQRLEMNPVREGEIYFEILQQYGCSSNQYQWLANKLGKSAYYVEGRVNIFKKLAPELKTEIGSKLSITNAIALSRLPKHEQIETFEKMMKHTEHLAIKNYDAYEGHAQHGYGNTDSPFCTCPKCHARHLKEVSIQDEAKVLESFIASRK